MKKPPALLLFILALMLMSSCKNPPVACFTILTPTDSIRVGHVVQFDASCTSDATQYYWDFGNGLNASTVTAQTTYDSATTYKVTLVAAGSGKSAMISKSVTVLP
jgi:PKD repeat protein